MIEAALPADEPGRLRALRRYGVLDTFPEPSFDDITHLASEICGTPIALVSLVDADRQWFKSRVGLEAIQTPRDIAFCAHAIHEQDLFEVRDALADERFHDNPLVRSYPSIRFYAGVPLTSPDGYNLGTLCVLDREARTLSPQQKESLRRLGRMVIAQLELRFARERADRFLSLPLDLVCVASLDGYFRRINPAFSQLLGYTESELLARPFLELVHPDDRAATQAEVARIATGANCLDFSNRYLCRDGSWRWLVWRAVPVVEEGLIYATARDTTELRNSVEAKGRLAAIVESAEDAILSRSLDGIVTTWNPAAERLFGYTEPEIVGSGITRLLPPELREEEPRITERILRGERVAQHESVRVRKDGSRVDVAVTASPLRDENGRIVGASKILRDISHQKRVEEGLQLRTAHLALQAEVGMALTRRRAIGEVLEDCSQAMVNHLGADLAQVWMLDATERMLELGARAGARAPPDEATLRVPLGAFPIGRIAAEGEPHLANQLGPAPWGGDQGWIEAEGLVAFAGCPLVVAGRVEGVLAVYARKPLPAATVGTLALLANTVGLGIARLRAESSLRESDGLLRAVNARLREQAGLLESANRELKDFAYIVSHDLKAPLRGISSLASWLVSDYADKLGPEGREQLGLLLNRTKRLNSLVDGILLYSRAGRVSEAPSTVNLDDLVRGIVDLLAPPPHVTIRIEPPLPTLECQATRIGQVFQNLLSNAIKYLDKPEGRVTVSAVREATAWRFSVADNGPGIEERYFEKIFQLFQTLAPRDTVESTGIGLSVVKRIVEMNGGRVWLESVPGQGTTFHFTLPTAQGAA